TLRFAAASPPPTSDARAGLRSERGEPAGTPGGAPPARRGVDRRRNAGADRDADHLPAPRGQRPCTRQEHLVVANLVGGCAAVRPAARSRRECAARLVRPAPVARAEPLRVAAAPATVNGRRFLRLLAVAVAAGVMGSGLGACSSDSNPSQAELEAQDRA